MTKQDTAIVGDNCTLQPNTIVGMVYREGCGKATIGKNSIIRAGTIIYGDVETGEYFQTGHNVMIRENTSIGDHVVIGTNTVVDGTVKIGSFVKIESNCYIPTHVTIGNRVFMGPGVTVTNDRFPLKLREDYLRDGPAGPVIEDLVTIGGGVTICPGVTIGEGSFVAAGAIVTKDVPPMSLVIGAPGKISPLPEKLQEENLALSWRKYL